ncbi:MAG: serine hydrolase domain-containing protein [Gemmatimonadaceae bacterium]
MRVVTTRHRHTVVWPLLLTCLLSATLGAQQDTSLASRIGRVVEEERLVGAVWALVTPNGVLSGAAGTEDVRTGNPLGISSRMQTGSVAKTVTAVGILRLVSEGRLALDTPVAALLRDLHIENPGRATESLRVRHLIDHTGGLDDARLWQVFTLRGDPNAPLLRGAPARLRLRSVPGNRASYSNTGFVLAGAVIERVTGVRYEAWLDSAILAPIGMRSSTTRFVTQADDPGLAMGHFDVATPAPSVAMPVRPAIQLTTTVDDMARLAQFLMSDGRVLGMPVVDSALLRAMGRPHDTEAARAGLTAGYGLGLVRRDRYGAVGRCHLGNQGNFRAALCIFADQGSAYFVALNSDEETANFARVDSLLTDALHLRPGATPVASSTGTDWSAWNGWYAVTPNRFQQFAYLDALGGATRVTWDGSSLAMRPIQGAARMLTPVRGRLLRAKGRLEPSHVALGGEGGLGAPMLSDGMQTWERVSPWRLSARWIGAALGIGALFFLSGVGGGRVVRAIRSGHLRDEPLRWAVAGVALLFVTPLLYLVTPALAIGDPSAANIAVAVATGLLPVAVGASMVESWRRERAARTRNLVALGAVLQWCVQLAWWGLLPLMLWR